MRKISGLLVLPAPVRWNRSNHPDPIFVANCLICLFLSKNDVGKESKWRLIGGGFSSRREHFRNFSLSFSVVSIAGWWRRRTIGSRKLLAAYCTDLLCFCSFFTICLNKQNFYKKKCRHRPLFFRVGGNTHEEEFWRELFFVLSKKFAEKSSRKWEKMEKILTTQGP